MQFIDVTAGPLERAFGLATVRLHTAAAARDAASRGWSARRPRACATASPSSARRRRPGCEPGTNRELAPPASAVARRARGPRDDPRLHPPDPDRLRRRHARRETPQLGSSPLIALAGVVAWLVTRWRIEDDDLRIETGLFRRQSLRFPLAQVQAIDVVRPGLARVFRVAELRLRIGGVERRRPPGSRTSPSTRSSRCATSCSRWPEARVTRKRIQPCRGAGAAGGARPGDRADRATGRLDPARELVAGRSIFVGLLVGLAVSPHTVGGLLVGGGFVWALSMATFVWRRFNQQYRLTVAEGPDGLHLRGGLVALTAEVIRPGRVQAVRLVEPLLWRPLGWCRLEVDVAGRQRRKGEGEAQRGQLRTLIPVGKRELAIELVDRLLPGSAARAVATTTASLLEEPVPIPSVELGPERHLRRDDERPTASRHLLGAAGEGAEPSPRPRAGAAATPSRERPRGHGRANRPRHAARPRRSRGRRVRSPT